VHRVALHSLDDIPEVQRIKVDAMKIDVEDHEQFVLRGALRTIMRDRPLVYCELWGGENKRACFALLEQCSYAACVATNAGLSPYVEGKRRHQFPFRSAGARVALASPLKGRRGCIFCSSFASWPPMNSQPSPATNVAGHALTLCLCKARGFRPLAYELLLL
jgi:hypothetical protein